MSDYYDGLRAANEQRVRWARLAREFERAVWRIHDAGTREDLERRFEEALQKPEADSGEAERLIADALNEIYLEAPLSYDEAIDAGLTAREWSIQVDRWLLAERERIAAISAAVPDTIGSSPDSEEEQCQQA